jgi:universal stress protein E
MNALEPQHITAEPVLRRILVATDFSPAGRLAVWRAGQLAQAHDAALHLVHARPDWNLFCRFAGASDEHYRKLAEHAEHALNAELGYVHDTFSIHARGETHMGRASEVLARAMAQIQPHLVVVGARGEYDQPQPGAPYLGGTALKLIAEADRPVLLVRNAGTGPYAVTLAAVDDSREMARRLIAWTSLMPPGDCHIVHAFNAPYAERMRAGGIAPEIINQCVEEARLAAAAYVEDTLSADLHHGRRLHTHVVRGEPIAAVLAEIERCRPQLVVIGKHQHVPGDSITRFVGTHALRIAYHTPSDVLLVT